MYHGSGLRGQISNCIQDGLVESIQLFPLQSLVEHLARVTTSPAKINVILFIGHRVLERRESEVCLRGAGEGALESWSEGR